MNNELLSQQEVEWLAKLILVLKDKPHSMFIKDRINVMMIQGTGVPDKPIVSLSAGL